MKKIILLPLILTTFSCTSTPVANISPSASITPSASASVSPVPSLTPTPSAASPAPIISASPTAIPGISPSPTVIPSPSTDLSNRIFTPGIGRFFSSLTDQTSIDVSKDRRVSAENTGELNPDFIVIDMRQKLADSNSDGVVDDKDKGWGFYDDIFEEIKTAKVNVNVIFAVKADEIPTQTTTPNLSAYSLFMKEAANHFNYPNVSWMIGEKINGDKFFPNKQKDYLNFLEKGYNSVKSVSKTIPVYAGSLVQAEISGKPVYFTAENLLSYINLGIGKYCDGFSLDFYSYSVETSQLETNTQYPGTNYKLISEYYKVLREVLDNKNLKDKKLFLGSTTYNSDIVGGVAQSEEAQANYNFRAMVYGTISGFDKVYLPKFLNEQNENTSGFFENVGLIGGNPGNESLGQKKLSYWSYKYITGKLKGAVYKNKMNNLPKGVEGFVFEKNSHKLYVIWNDNFGPENLKLYDTVAVNIEGKKGKIYTLPYSNEINGLEDSFSLEGENKTVNLHFNTHTLVPRIIEIFE